MSTLQGIVRRNTINALSQYEKLAYHSENLANSNTNAYKAVRFENTINENGYVGGEQRTNFTQGLLRMTNNPMDVALDGSGFIPITNKKGEILYTRDGSFTTNKDGVLVTYAGDIVGSGIKIGSNYKKLEIKENGDVYTYFEKNSEPEYKGTIPVVTFVNPEGLKEVGNNNYVKTDDSGEAELAGENQKFVQNHIEASNVDIFDQVNDIMRMNTSLLATTTMLKRIDEMYQQAINLRE